MHLSAEISPEQWRLLEHTQQKYQLESLDDALDFIVSQYGVLASVREDQALKWQFVQEALALQPTQDITAATRLAETLLEALFAYVKTTSHEREQTRYDSLKDAYKQALELWDTSGEAEIWDSATADGLPADW